MEEHFRFLFINYGSDGLAFLTAYFRHPETLPYHADIIKYANDQDGKQPFAKAIASANKKASKWGGLSPSRRLKSWARKVPIVVAAIGTGLGAAYNNWFTVDEFTPVETRVPSVIAPLLPGDRRDIPLQNDQDEATDISENGSDPTASSDDLNASSVDESDGVSIEEVPIPEFLR